MRDFLLINLKSNKNKAKQLKIPMWLFLWSLNLLFFLFLPAPSLPLSLSLLPSFLPPWLLFCLCTLRWIFDIFLFWRSLSLFFLFPLPPPSLRFLRWKSLRQPRLASGWPQTFCVAKDYLELLVLHPMDLHHHPWPCVLPASGFLSYSTLASH